MTFKLKPCPLCGGEAELLPDFTIEYFVCCKECHLSTNKYYEDYQAVEAWNRREKENK